MNGLFVRRKQAQQFTALEESQTAWTEKVTPSVSQVATDLDEVRHEGRDLETGLNGGSHAVVIEAGADIGAPSPAHVKDRETT